MKNLTKRFTLSAAKGFTLIELLIVIAVLGVLAVAVLSAMNPIEQINRGKDTGSRSDAEQIIGAIDRYYTGTGIYPWQVNKDTTNSLAWVPIDEAWAQTGGTVKVLGLLDGTATGGIGAAGELKQSFTGRLLSTSANYNTLKIFMRGGIDVNTGDSYYVCFKPASSSFKIEANKRCSLAGSTDGDVNGAGLPADLRPHAAVVCAVSAPWSCLP